MAGEDPELLAALEQTRAELELARASREKLLGERGLRIAAEESLLVVRSELDAARAREESVLAAIQRARKDQPTRVPAVGVEPGVHFGGAAERGGGPTTSEATPRRGRVALRLVMVSAIGAALSFTESAAVQALSVLGLLVAAWVVTRKVDR